MDGYTVEEAASVLGVPRERVWELLARGVLSGSTDLGGAMRVRLKAEARVEPPIPAPERPQEPAAAELTPFRELLTEFRSLTERYGQALLALGESRGEVATLRSRVELLEARVDLRLPPVAEPIRAAWDATPSPVADEPRPEAVASEPHAPEPEAEPAEVPTAAAAPDEASVDAQGVERAPERLDAEPVVAEGAPDGPQADVRGAVEDADADEQDAIVQPRRARDGRRATEHFADALARADDPSPPELPGAEETAAALAALRQASPDPGREIDREEGDEEAGLPRELPSAEQMPVAEEPEPEPARVGTPGDTPSERERVPGEHDATSEPASQDAEGIAAEAADEEPEDHASGVAERSREHGEPGWDPDVYSPDIGEPGWISADDVAVAPTGWRPPSDEPGPSSPPERTSQPPAPSSGEPQGTGTGGGGWRDEPAAEDEPDEPWPWGPTSQSASANAPEWPRSRQLDEGLAALDALAHPGAGSTEAPVAPRPLEGSPYAGRPAASMPTSRPAQAWTRTTPPPPLGVRSPASRAYRRLRRIFPT